MESTQLSLTKISRLHMGDYLCVASNGIPPPTSKNYRIHVNCNATNDFFRVLQFFQLFYLFSVPPMFWIPNQLEGAYMGQDVTLECHSEAFPPSINYWEKEDGNTLISGE